MPGTTITSNTTTGVTLTTTGQNPVTVNAGITVNPAAADAIYGNATFPWTISNLGTLTNTAATATNPPLASFSGIGLAAGGLITNGATNNAVALVSATAATAIRINGTGTLINFGTVNGLGTKADGADLAAGGTVANNAGATLSGGAFGISMPGAGGVVTNLGTITGTAQEAIHVPFGASVTNGATNATTALISGLGGIVATSAALTVTNFGTIAATNGTDPATGLAATGILLGTGGTITNGVSGATIGVISAGPSAAAIGVAVAAGRIGNYGTILGGAGITASSGVTVTNAGSILGTVASGISLAAGGTLSNAAAALISGTQYGVFATAAAVTLTNAGTITGTSRSGVSLTSGGAVTNSAGGTITGGTAGSYAGVALQVTGAVINNAGLIQGGRGVSLFAPGTVINQGSIAGSTFYAAVMAGGTLTNSATGTIAGPRGGVIDQVGALTLTNAGSIGGSVNNDGVSMAGGGTLSNLAGGTIAGYFGIQLSGATSTITNAGSITGKYGISIAGTGSITNSGGITGTTRFAIQFSAGTLTNGASGGTAGTILGGSYGLLQSGGVTTNFGSIAGGSGGIQLSRTASLSNSGTIGVTGTGINAIYASGAATISNLATGVIAGQAGIVANGTAGLLIANFGSISGSGSGAGVQLNSGTLNNGTAAGSTARITAAAVAVRAYGTASSISNFGTIFSPTTGLIQQNGATVSNSGTISGTGQNGVYLSAATFTNASQGIVNGYFAIRTSGTLAANVVNAGTIASNPTASAGGVLTNAPGTISNTGSIIGNQFGVQLGALGTVLNSATITGANNYAVWLDNGGVIVNGTQGSTALLSAGNGAYFQNGNNTITNGGTIIGRSGIAIRGNSGNTGINRLIDLPGAVFGNGTATGIGRVVFPGNATNVLELASASSTGSIAGLGTAFYGFGNTTIDAGATWMLTGANTLSTTSTLTNAGALTILGATVTGSGALVNNGSLLIDPSSVKIASLSGTGSLTLGPASTLTVTGAIAAGQTIGLAGTADLLALGPTGAVASPIAGFVTTDTIDLTAYAHHAGDQAVLLAGNTLQVSGSGGTITLPLAATDNFTGKFFHLAADAATGSNLTVDTTPPCFASFTRIATPSGPVPVEALRVGDLVLTHDGDAVPVQWLGHRRVDCRRHPRPQDVLPIRIQPHAFAKGQPSRDLVLSPDHAVFADGVLIPIRYLLNGASIAQQAVAHVTYWHVELPEHAVLLAEGLPCESYLDTGNRHAFAKAGPAIMAHPDFAPALARDVWEHRACAELVLKGPKLDRLRYRLLDRALAAGHAWTTDPQIELQADGVPLPSRRDNDRLIFAIPQGAAELRLVSRVWTPAHFRSDDHRRLGIAVAALELDGTPHHPPAGDGWHAPEHDGQWTDGHAGILPAGARELAVTLAMTGRYWTGQVRRSTDDSRRAAIS